MKLWGRLATLALTMSVAGCAQDGSSSMMLAPQSSALSTGTVASANTAVQTAAGPADGDYDPRQALKKNRASKVLAAIALERVTGRKPDPGRLVD